MTNYYITKQCNLRCRYCYPPGSEKDVETDLALELLKKIRPHSPAINFTGGEPVLHPDLPLLLKAARQLRFYPIVLSTNALEIDRLVPHLHAIDHLIVSLDSLRDDNNDKLTGVPGSTRRVVHNIEKLSSLVGKEQFNLSLHAVVCQENLDCLEALSSFCEQLNATLNVSPEHVGEHPIRELCRNEKYSEAIRRLRTLKREGKPISASHRYLEIIQTFKPHMCYPFLSPRVEPDGRVYFPCYVIRERSVYLQDYENLYQLMRQEAEWMHDRLECRERCFLACYLEVASFVQNPLCLLREIPFRRQTLAHSRRSTWNSVQSPGEE
jgi:MoaA/NifB/PqqE/SkfB family radical SAM enzyme